MLLLHALKQKCMYASALLLISEGLMSNIWKVLMAAGLLRPFNMIVRQPIRETLQSTSAQLDWDTQRHCNSYSQEW